MQQKEACLLVAYLGWFLYAKSKQVGLASLLILAVCILVLYTKRYTSKVHGI